jgi:hypothetical protein
VIQGIQLVTEKLFDWNNMVPKIYMIETETLHSSLKEWRKMERKGWKSVNHFIKILNNKEKDVELTEMGLMIKLTKVLSKKQKIDELYPTLEQYLKYAKLG